MRHITPEAILRGRFGDNLEQMTVQSTEIGLDILQSIFDRE